MDRTTHFGSPTSSAIWQSRLDKTDQTRQRRPPMKRTIKRILKVVGIVIAVALVGGGAWAGYQVHAYNASMGRTYDVPAAAITRSTDPAVLDRGKHIVESIGACSSKDCHGGDFGGGDPIKMGPLGT